MNDFRQNFSAIEAEIENSKYSKLLEEIKQRSTSAPVILYGAGTAAGFALFVLLSENMAVTAICDKQKTGMFTKSGMSIPIITPEQLLRDYRNAIVIITSWHFEMEITEYLKDIGFPIEHIFPLWYPQRIPLNEFKDKFYDGYEWAYNFFSDEISKQTIVNRVRSYLTSQPLIPNTLCKKYYDSALTFGDEEVFIDGGAADGDSIATFLKKTNGKYQHIYAFEPDTECYAKLLTNTSELNNIDIFNTGLGDINEQRRFFFDRITYSSYTNLDYYIVSPDKVTYIPYKSKMCDILTIDSIQYSKPQTFIKLCLEGYEKEALLGAKSIIKQYKPKLAVCAYHRIDDVYTLPQTIHEIRDDYKFILRQCDYGYYETVLYAW